MAALVVPGSLLARLLTLHSALPGHKTTAPSPAGSELATEFPNLLEGLVGEDTAALAKPTSGGDAPHRTDTHVVGRSHSRNHTGNKLLGIKRAAPRVRDSGESEAAGTDSAILSTPLDRPTTAEVERPPLDPAIQLLTHLLRCPDTGTDEDHASAAEPLETHISAPSTPAVAVVSERPPGTPVTSVAAARRPEPVNTIPSGAPVERVAVATAIELRSLPFATTTPAIVRKPASAVAAGRSQATPQTLDHQPRRMESKPLPAAAPEKSALPVESLPFTASSAPSKDATDRSPEPVLPHAVRPDSSKNQQRPFRNNPVTPVLKPEQTMDEVKPINIPRELASAITLVEHVVMAPGRARSH